jgi:hypothetical protein
MNNLQNKLISDLIIYVILLLLGIYHIPKSSDIWTTNSWTIFGTTIYFFLFCGKNNKEKEMRRESNKIMRV